MMNPDTLAIIRKKIPEEDMTQERIERLLLSSITMFTKSEDIRDRARIVTALGYDPEDKWK